MTGKEILAKRNKISDDAFDRCCQLVGHARAECAKAERAARAERDRIVVLADAECDAALEELERESER